MLSLCAENVCISYVVQRVVKKYIYDHFLSMSDNITVVVLQTTSSVTSPKSLQTYKN